jgi:5-methylcytosine-specific restriction endonuclease McrA
MRHTNDPLTIPCPTCQALPGHPCLNLTIVERDTTCAPHAARRAPVASTCLLCGSSVTWHATRRFCGPCSAPDRARLRSAVGSATSRGLAWALTLTQAEALLAAPCHYCGGPGGGIDRVDPGRPYEPTNVVAACWPCNNMKGTMTMDEWLAHMRKVISRFGVMER